MTKKTSVKKKAARKSKQAGKRSQPRRRAEAPEVILKEAFSIDGTGEPYAFPIVRIMGNPAGLRLLAQELLVAANQKSFDADDHYHFPFTPTSDGMNVQLSDEIELYIVPYNADTRDEALATSGVRPDTCKRGDIVPRCKAMIKAVRAHFAYEERLRRKVAAERRVEKAKQKQVKRKKAGRRTAK